MNYSIVLTETAQTDLSTIFRYIAVELQSVQNTNAQLSSIEKAIASLDQMPERYRAYDRESWRDLSGLRLFLFAQFIVLYLSQPRNFTLGRRLQDKKRHDVDRLMVSVMSFIVYGGVSGEVRAGDCSYGISIVPEGENRCAYTCTLFHLICIHAERLVGH